MDLKQIKELMTAMEKAGMKKLTLKEKTGFELHLERQDDFPPAASHSVYPQTSMFIPHPTPKAHDFSHPLMSPASSEEDRLVKGKATEKVEGKFISSPMVGTFYGSPSPEDPLFVKVGDRVEENTVVCIIEAMKVMNEVKAGMSGVIAESCLENGHPVEFGTKLFRVV
ncbi:MAG: acetyl-CoA carboxylase biotin carboxyl carrier protein [Chlamydiota bacterium]